MEKIIIAYCRDNIDLARYMDDHLSRIGLAFDHLTNLPGAAPGQFASSLQASQGPVILLVTDNLLRNLNCMTDATDTFKAMVRNNRIMPIVADGIKVSDDEKTKEKVPTRFDRVIHAIQYLNYWQGVYLEINAQIEHYAEPQKTQAMERLGQIRKVNEQISDFLNTIRDHEYLLWEDFKKNDFELFFKKFGIHEWHDQFRKLNQPGSLSSTDIMLKAETNTVLAEQKNKTHQVISNTQQPETPGQEYRNGAHTAPMNGEHTPKTATETPTKLTVNEGVILPPAQVVNMEELLQSGEETPNPEPIAEKEALVFEEPNPELVDVVPNEPKPNYGQSYLDNIHTINQSVERFLAIGDQPSALATLKHAMERYPQDDNLRFSFVRIKALSGQNDNETEAELKTLEESEYPQFKILDLRGDLAFQANELIQARDYWAKAVDLEPDAASIHMKLGDLLETHFKGAKRIAAQHFKSATEIAEDDPKPFLRYANIMLEYLDKPKKAAKYYRRAAELQPTGSEAWYGLALSEHHSGNGPEAAEAYQRAVQIEPSLRSDTLDKLFKPYFLEPQNADIKPITKKLLTVLVTGATSGIGKATAALFASHGHQVILTGRRAERLTEMDHSIKALYPDAQVHIAPFDVRNNTEVYQFVQNLPLAFQNIDILVNNAGLARGLSFIHEADIDDWETMIDTNIKGLLYMTRAIAPLMVARKKGHIINVSSIAGQEVYPKGNVYCATKWAVEALTKGMRLDLHQHNIRVSQVSPGHVEETEFALTRFHGDAEKARIYEDFDPLKASDVADAIYYIATRPDYVNIQDIKLFGTQQASSTVINRSGRKNDKEIE